VPGLFVSKQFLYVRKAFLYFFYHARHVDLLVVWLRLSPRETMYL
jgi:hypothetical protein